MPPPSRQRPTILPASGMCWQGMSSLVFMVWMWTMRALLDRLQARKRGDPAATLLRLLRVVGDDLGQIHGVGGSISAQLSAPHAQGIWAVSHDMRPMLSHRARMCSGVVPQQPPTMFAPAPIRRVIWTANSSGVV